MSCWSFRSRVMFFDCLRRQTPRAWLGLPFSGGLAGARWVCAAAGWTTHAHAGDAAVKFLLRHKNLRRDQMSRQRIHNHFCTTISLWSSDPPPIAVGNGGEQTGTCTALDPERVKLESFRSKPNPGRTLCGRAEPQTRTDSAR